MTPKEHLIERLRALCEAAGGPDAVAERAEASAENLRQILAGTKLPTGQPRGVGPNLQRKLDVAYPNWSGLSTGGAHSAVDWPFPAVDSRRYWALSPEDRGYVQGRMMAAIEDREAAAVRGAASEKQTGTRG